MKLNRGFKRAPYLLTALRAGLGPLLLATADLRPDRTVLGICLITAFVSDILDGMIARRLGIATATLRRLDSIADSIFYLCALVAVWILNRGVLLEHALMLSTLLFLECLRYVFDLRKFGREASYHMWSSKLWGLTLFIAFYAVLVAGEGTPLVAIAIMLGIIADLEGLLISYTLRSWHHDVPTIVHALRIRAGEDADQPNPQI